MKPGIYSNPSQPTAFVVVDSAGNAYRVPAPAGWEKRTPFAGNVEAFRRLPSLEAESIARVLLLPAGAWSKPKKESAK